MSPASKVTFCLSDVLENIKLHNDEVLLSIYVRKHVANMQQKTFFYTMLTASLNRTDSLPVSHWSSWVMISGIIAIFMASIILIIKLLQI